MKKILLLFCVGTFLSVSCNKQEPQNEPETQISNVSFTACKSSDAKSNELSNVDVQCTAEGVEIAYSDFTVACDFTDVEVTHTFENGVLRITQKDLLNFSSCACFIDVSYTVDGISENEVTEIFINNERVYCHTDNNQIENLLVGRWRALDYTKHNDTIHFTADMRVEDYFMFAHTAIYPADSYYFTYSLTEDTIEITWHQPENKKYSETFKYVENDNLLIIKGFRNPFSATLEARNDVYFRKIEDNGNQSNCDQNVIISKTEYENAPKHPISIIDMKIANNCLKIKVGASGCNGNNWNVQLIDREDVAESMPCQRTLRISLDDIGLCAAYFENELSFNIEDLQIKGDRSALLNIEGKSILYEY
jgi:hypothetical protein